MLLLFKHENWRHKKPQTLHTFKFLSLVPWPNFLQQNKHDSREYIYLYDDSNDLIRFNSQPIPIFFFISCTYEKYAVAH